MLIPFNKRAPHALQAAGVIIAFGMTQAATWAFNGGLDIRGILCEKITFTNTIGRDVIIDIVTIASEILPSQHIVKQFLVPANGVNTVIHMQPFSGEHAHIYITH